MAYIFTHGSGTAEDPYQVETADDLNGVRDYLSAHFIQMADIDLSEIDNWVGISTFSGTYNGNKKIISKRKNIKRNCYEIWCIRYANL